MSESGGTTTQSGIYYQNSIAALFLGRLVDPTRALNQCIDSVRVEAPEVVDDIVVTYLNGNKEYIQAKESLNLSSEAWKKLWYSFRDQAATCLKDGGNYSLTLTISNTSSTLQSLKELCERANGKDNLDEWWNSLNTKHQEIASNIGRCIKAESNNSTFTLLKTVDVKVIPFNDIENDQCPNWIPDSCINKTSLFSHLRDMVGGYARIRRTFNCSKLLEELLSKYEITIPDSPNWGVDVYKKTIKNEFHLLTVPGTDLSGAIDDLFMWPELYESTSPEYQYFEFEDLSAWREVKPKSFYELKNFPNEEISQAIINAGAGLGKTTLLKAIAFQLTQHPIIVPAFIPLSALIDSTAVISFLNTRLNDEYQINIDWNYMSSAGRVAVFFDGLDELSDSERQNVLGKITKYIARYPQISFLLTVRDSSILTNQLDVKLLEIKRLTDDKIIEFTKAYNRSGAIIDSEILLEHAKHHPDLAHLLRIPLFLALVLATHKPNENLPRSRAEILECYLEILLSPEKFKPSQESSDTEYLREATEYLAYAGLNKKHIGFNKKEVLQYLRSLAYCEKPSRYLESLIKYGIFTSISSRLQFTYPTIQEYLAAQYILENNPEELINGFEKIIHKPWAQTIQFALESYPSSNEIIEKQLKKPDDVFFTSLRLIARCVINGAKVEKNTQKHLGKLLSEAWSTDSTMISESIGYLLLDGYTCPLPELAEKYIINGWALHYGGAKILSAKKDNFLTEKVLVQMLSKDLHYRYHLHEWQEAVDEMAEKALDLYIERALDENTDKNEIDALRSLINNLDESNIPKMKWKGVVEEKSLPVTLRLVAAMKIPALVQKDMQQLYSQLKKEWIESPKDYEYSYAFTRIFWNMPKCELLKLIKEKTLPDEHLEELIASFFVLSSVDEDNLGLMLNLYSSELLSDDMKFKLNLLLSSRDEFTDQVYATEHLQVQNLENIERWCFLIGHLDRETALKGLDLLSSRSLNKKEYINILSMLVTGLNYIMKPTLSRGGVLDVKYYHPATPEFSNWLIGQYSQFEFNERELICVLNNISLISPEKIEYDIEALFNEILSSFDPSIEIAGENLEFECAINNGFNLCEREKIQLSESCLMRIILLKQHNLMSSALRQLLKIATKNTAKTLISIHNDLPSGHRRGMVIDTIEKLSSRFSFRVIDVDGALQIAIQ